MDARHRARASCGVCGAPVPPPFRLPPPEQAPDLDFRPGEPGRSTLRLWVRTCRGCQAAAPDLAALAADAPVGSDAYRSLRDAPPGTLAFRRWALLCPPAERHEAWLWAAWAADDAGDAAAARALRDAALAAWPTGDGPGSAHEMGAAPGSGAARRIDVLRRAGRLAEAAAACDAAAGVDPLVVAFQRARIAAADTGRHLLSSALRPPARTPHAAHGAPPPSAPWRRLWGR